jgi:hypothetical protein
MENVSLLQREDFGERRQVLKKIAKKHVLNLKRSLWV